MGKPKPLTIYRNYLERVAIDPTVTHDELADEMYMNPQVYRARWHQGKIEHEMATISHLGDPLHIEGDALVIGDIHAPYTDPVFWQLALQVGKKHLKKPRQCIIGGDWSNQDVFSRYEPTVRPPSWAEEREAMRAQVRDLLGVFDRVYWIMGNHDRRLIKAMGGELDDEDMLAMIVSNPKFQSTNYGWCTVTSGGKKWRITHPAGYSQLPANYARELAAKHEANVISFHEHHLAQTWDKFGRFVVVNGGCLVDPAKLAYVMLDDNKAPAMQRGFVLLKNGTAHLFGDEPFTDWSRWL